MLNFPFQGPRGQGFNWMKYTNSMHKLIKWFYFLLRVTNCKCEQFHKLREFSLQYVCWWSCSSNFQLSSLRICQEGDGESAFAAIFEEIIRETGIRGIISNRQIVNIFREKIGTLHAEFKRASGGFGVNRLADKWRYRLTMLRYFITS